MAASFENEYLALARKYRPMTFDDVVGQEYVISALRNTIDAKRLHHAYLLTGTRGIGKTTIARIIAKSLQCEMGISSKPCGKCAACVAVTQGTYPDVIEIDAASQTKVDDTRAMLENTQYPPMQGRYKIYIIDEVHMLTTSSFNALLKTLEEPPSYVKFILATTDPHKIPTTVLSRCLKFQLRALRTDEISKRIIDICAHEQIVCQEDATMLLARAAKGSMRDALSLCDQAIALGGGQIQKDTVVNMLGSVGDENIELIFKVLLDDQNVNNIDVLNQIYAQSPNYKQLLDELVVAFHDLSLYQLINGTKLEVFTLSPSLLQTYASKFSAQDLQLYYQITLEGLKDYAIAQDGKLVFEMTYLRLLAFCPVKKKIG